MKVRVYLHSKPGTWEFYRGHVDVVVDDASDAFAAACAKLRRSAFRGRPASAWVLERLEVAPWSRPRTCC